MAMNVLPQNYKFWGNKDILHTGDFNGDGLPDLLALSSVPGRRWVGLSDGEGGFTCSAGDGLVSLAMFEKDSQQSWTGDFNGDGLTDIFSIGQGNGSANRWIGLSNGDGTFDFTEGYGFLPENLEYYSSVHKVLTGDFNGDGLTDICQVSASNGTAPDRWIGLSKGDGSFTFTEGDAFLSANVKSYLKADILALDFNGDGLTDLFSLDSNGGTEENYRWLGLSDGDGGFTITSGYGLVPEEYKFWGELDLLRSGDFNGDGLPDLLAMSPTPAKRWVGLNGHEAARLTKVTQGFQTPTTHGVVTEIEYRPLTDPDIYVKGSGAEYPVRDIISPMHVVSTLTKDNGQGGTYDTDYTYRAARQHLHGRGFLGFQQFESYDWQTKLSYVETLAHDFPFTGRPLQTETYYIPDPDGNTSDPGYSQPITLVENDWFFDLVAGGTLFTYSPRSAETKWELGEPATPISTITTLSWFDGQDTSVAPPTAQPDPLLTEITHGNLSQTVVDYGGDLKQTTANTYDDWVDDTHWLLGRLDTLTTTNKATGKPDVIRSSSFDYYADINHPSYGLLAQETIEPGDPVFELVADYFYDTFGNIERKAITGVGIPTHNVQYDDYDAKGRFVDETRNALDHATTFIFDQAIGKPLSSTDPNFLTTHWQYDETGRTVYEERPDGTETTMLYTWDYTTLTVPDGPGSAGTIEQTAAYNLLTTTDGAAPVTVWYDKQGREIRTQTQSADGRLVNKDTGYNAIAQPIAVSEPYFVGDTPVYTFTEYDGLGRPQYVTAPDGTVTEQVYEGLTSKTIADSNHRTTGTPKHQVTTTIKNARGDMLSVTDAMPTPNTITYDYDAAGNLTRTIDPASNTIEIEYDLRGNKKRQDDPDMGEWFYTYNALDQLVDQTDANGNRIETTYDLLGRPSTRINSVMTTSGLKLEGTASWFYDGTLNGAKLGTLRREEHRDALGQFINRKTFAYDQYSRPMFELRNYDSKWYYTTLRYDAFSRVEFVDRFWRPVGKEGTAFQLDTEWHSFGTKNTYNGYGALTEVRDTTAANQIWWECTAADYDQQGRLVQSTYGNGLKNTTAYNPHTGLTEGIGIWSGATEVSHYGFGYDRLGNLESRVHSRPLMTTLSETCTYDALNRLLNVDGASSSVATYDALGNIQTRGDITEYLYGTRPHAVTSATSTDSTVLTYFYDLNGNVVRRDRNGQYEFTANWNSFNKPSSLFSGMDGSEFEYGVNGKRTRQLIFENGTVRKKIYVAETYEMEELLSNPTETDRSLWVWTPVHSRIYIDTPAGRIGIYQEAASTDGTGTVTKSWLHKDHLGSVIGISDASSTLTYQSYDAWGNQRDADDWTPITNTSNPVTDRGYTGHEMLSNLDLVHMNGRIYDPVIGRMISPDPIIQSPDNLQSYNRYSYVMNRPLSLTDPSGFSAIGLMAQAASSIYKTFVEPIVSEPISEQDSISGGSDAESLGWTTDYWVDQESGDLHYTTYLDGYQIDSGTIPAPLIPAKEPNSAEGTDKTEYGLNTETSLLNGTDYVGGSNKNNPLSNISGKDPNYVPPSRPRPAFNKAPPSWMRKPEIVDNTPSDTEMLMSLNYMVGHPSPGPRSPAGTINAGVISVAVLAPLVIESGITPIVVGGALSTPTAQFIYASEFATPGVPGIMNLYEWEYNSIIDAL